MLTECRIPIQAYYVRTVDLCLIFPWGIYFIWPKQLLRVTTKLYEYTAQQSIILHQGEQFYTEKSETEIYPKIPVAESKFFIDRFENFLQHKKDRAKEL